jgi:hypothetical protein
MILAACVTPQGFGGESVNCSSIGFQALIIIVSGVLNYLIRTERQITMNL